MKKRVMFGIMALVSVGFIQSANAAYKWEGFDGGNAAGFTKLGNYRWLEKGMNTDWKQWRAGSASWGGILMSSNVTSADAGEGGGYWQNSGGYNGGAAFESRACVWGNSENNSYVWAGWWTYNDRQTYANYYEIDMMETGHTGNFMNYYYHWSNGAVVGTFWTAPNSINWRASWNNYKCWVQNGTRVHFYFNGGWKKAIDGANRTAEYARPKYQSHAWPLTALNAGNRTLPTMYVDFYQVWY